MRLWLSALLASALLLWFHPAQAQDAVSERDWIAIAWDFQLFDPHGGLATPATSLTDLQNSVKETLSASGITPYSGAEPDFDIGIALFGDQQLLVTIDPRVLGDQLPHSPILFAHPYLDLMQRAAYYEIAFTYRPNAVAAAEAAQNFLVAISLYSINRCDLADHFFSRAQSHASALHYAWEANSEAHPRDLSDLIAFYRGNCALMRGSYADAAHQFEQALLSENAVVNLSPAVNLAWTYLQLDQADQAFRILDQLVTSQTNDLLRRQALVSSSQLYALAFRYDEAIADMDAAIALDLDNPLLYVERGQRIMLLYEWDRALADYNHALELAPTYADAYYYRAVLYASVPEGIDARQAALADFERYLELAPSGQHADAAARNIIDLHAQLAALSPP